MLRLLFVTSEIDDYVRTGGLAAVSAALPRALRLWTDTRLVIPGYTEVLTTIGETAFVGTCPPLAGLPACEVRKSETQDGLPVYVVVCPQLFERVGTPYGDPLGNDWSDNDIRFARFASAAALLATGSVDTEWQSDVVHVNDWQAGLVPAYLAWDGKRLPSVMTIHNLAYQGNFDRSSLGRIGAPDQAFQIDGIEFYGKVSFLKAGLVYASHLTTVSETYAREITTERFGCGFDGILRKRAECDQLTGILNGIDSSWDALTCVELATRFGVGDWRGRRSNTSHLRRNLGLAIAAGPLFGLVARLVHQKGIDLVLTAAETIVSSGGQIVVMGQGETKIEGALQDLQARYPRSVAVSIGFEEAEARRIFAASDFTLMPSRFEPCGLSQMYAQKFGSLPIGHRTGGLAETIKDGLTGFLFDQPSSESLMGAVCRAFGAFSNRRKLHEMRANAMNQNFEWKQSAASYVALYDRAIAGKA